MPHRDEPLDEGVLHAFLDGALPAEEAAGIEARARASAETRAQIDLARQLRTEAETLIELVQLEPTFRGAAPITRRDAVAAAARPGGTAAPARAPWYRRRLDRSAMGWAAGLLLLVGAVWFGTPTGSSGAPEAKLAAAPAPTAEAAPSPAAAPASAPTAAVPDMKAPAMAAAAKASPPAATAGAADRARLASAPAVAAAAPAAPPPAAELPAPSLAAADAAGATANALRETEERKFETASPPSAPARLRRAAPTVSSEERPGSAPDALAKLGANAVPVLQVAGLGAGRIEQLSDGGVRTVYEGANGAPPIVLEQWQIATQPADLRADAIAAAQHADRATVPSIRWQQHGVQLRLSGKVSVDSLERLRRRVE